MVVNHKATVNRANDPHDQQPPSMAGRIDSRILTVLSIFPEIELVILFGSAGADSLKPHSDIDIAIASPFPISSELKANATAALALALERPIDLVDLNRAPQPLVASVLASGRILQNRDPEVYASIMRRLWRWNEDMKSNHDTMLAIRRERAFTR